MTALQPSGGATPNQTTGYVYGVGSTGNLFSEDLIAKDPDKTTGAASTAAANDQSFGYNFQGDKTSFTDQNGSTHGYNYDVLGRLTADIITTFGGGVNNTVKRLGYSFDTAGRPYQQTSYTNTGGTTVLNQVQDAYNGFGQLITEYQEHVGAVNTSTSKKVQYGYTGGTNFSRLTSVTDPNGRVITYGYNTGLDSTISRVSYLADGSTTLESYTYLGLGTIVQKYRQQPNITLSYIQQSGDKNPPPSTAPGGDRYTGLDAFGRVIDQPWIGASGINSPTDRFQYGYDRDSNPLYKNNLVSGTFSELYHANAASSGDDNTAYDSLGRLTNFRRGTLSASSYNNGVLDTVSTLNTLSGSSNSWSLDALGNWTSTAGGSQTRGFNAQNQITSITSLSTPTYDNNGNMLSDEAGNNYTYDAWNRMIFVSLSGGSFPSELYSYDADNRRPGLSICSGSVSDSYYTTQWQDIEDDVSGGSNPGTSTFVWGLSYIDDLMARDTNAGGPTRIYAQQDGNHDVTSLVNASGSVLQRYAYDPYGSATILNAGMTAVVSDGYFWVYSFQGGRYDSVTGKINFRNRDLDTVTGTWMEQDPAHYVNGADLYAFLTDNPLSRLDPFGMDGEPVESGGGDFGPDPNDPEQKVTFTGALRNQTALFELRHPCLTDPQARHMMAKAWLATNGNPEAAYQMAEAVIV